MREKPRHEVQRVRQRAHYDEPTVHAVLDAGWLAHVAFAGAGQQPFVIPMLYVREERSLLLHGSIASRLMRTLGDGIDACVCATLVDGLVLARSHFHHSVNYRSVVAFGRARPVGDGDGKAAALARFVDAMIPGRAGESRPADRNELAATALLRFDIADASAKIRSGGPKDDPADAGLPIWSGVVPMALRCGEPLVADDATPGLAVPASVRTLAG
ncbi:MAG: pyridoxamine 5'-phosphate oxidase family protein [Xanthomonadales bacterium]|nr:pyridoxamine 5'-phosphate oxidase family protein [Xanthomonadales bacterium]